RRVPANKVEAVERLGAQVVIGEADQAEAEDRARRLQREQGSVLVHPYDDPWVIAGQGTIGLELLDEVPDVDTVLVPLSGGGLISGIALALKSASPSIRVVGVTMEGGAAMHRSLQAGKVVDVVEEDTLADALAGGLGSPNRYTFNMCRRYVDGTVLVSEDEIAEAMVFCLEEHHLVVEGGGAVGVAALLHRKVQPGENTVVVISGGNVDPSLLMRVVKERS
ncbi:MAG: threonine/serine dehydratase, partial [Acidimicrobiia bacterium]